MTFEPLDLLFTHDVLFRVEVDDAPNHRPALLMRVCRKDRDTQEFVPMSRIFVPLAKVQAVASMLAQAAAQLEGQG